MNCFFVCGAPKSGTTWLQWILDAHPEVSCSGEGHFVTRFSGPLAQVVNDYNKSLRVEGSLVYEGTPPYGPVGQVEFDDLVRAFIARRLQSREAGPQVRWFGDKTPRYTHQLDRLHRLFPDARFIHIVRDPRDVVVSRLAHNVRAGHADAFQPDAESHRLNLEAAITGWVEAVEKVAAFAKAHPGQVHELRYWDLHGDTVAEVTRLFGFLGVDTSPALMRRIAAQTSFEAMSGRKAGEEDSRSFLRKGQPGDWRERLAPDSAERVVQACARLMAEKRFSV